MIDALDNQTQALPLEQPAKRGRPATGKALSNADRQRAYRERQKALRDEKGEREREDPVRLREALERLGDRQLDLEKELMEWKQRARKAEAQLAQRNDKPEKTWTLQGRTGTGKWQNLAAGLDEKEASRQLDRVIDAKISGKSKRQYRMVQDY